MNVKDCMSTQVIAVSPEENAAVAARLMARHNVGALPVCTADRQLQGMLTDRDIVLRCVAANRDPEKVPVRHVMTGRVVTVDADMDVEDAIARMSREQVRRLPVEDRGKLCGMLTLGDLANSPKFTMEAAGALGQICTGISNR